jgi:hypothetical protein
MKRVILVVLLAMWAEGCSDSTGPGGHGAGFTPPTISGVIDSWDGSQMATLGLLASTAFQGGDTVYFSAEVSDSTGLRWMGVTIGGPFAAADSFAIPDSIARLKLGLTGYLVIPEAYLGEVRIAAFATDRHRNRVEEPMAGSPAWVYPTVSMPAREGVFDTIALSFAFDPVRDRLYFARLFQPELGVFDVGQMVQLPSIPLPGDAWDLDRTVDGNSLVASLLHRGTLALVPIDAPTTIREQSVTSFTPDSLTPKYVRIGANGHALVSLTDVRYTGAVGRLLDYDLAAGTGRLLPAAGLEGTVSDDVPIIAALSRRYLVAFTWGMNEIQVFDGATGGLGPLQPTVEQAWPRRSIDSAGANFIVARSLFSRTTGFQHSYGPPGGGWVSSIALDGTVAYFGTSDGFVRVRLEDGRVLDRVILGWEPGTLIPLPGTKRLLLLAAGHAAEVTLTAPPAMAKAPMAAPATPRLGGLRMRALQ